MWEGTLFYLLVPSLQSSISLEMPFSVIFSIVNVVTKWTNLSKNQETLIYMVKTLVPKVMSSTTNALLQPRAFLHVS